MTPQEARALVERQARSWEAADIPAILADFAPDGLFISPGGRWQGYAQIRAAVAAFFETADSVEVSVVRVFASDTLGACEWVWRETRKADGSHHTAEDAIIFEVDGAGKLVYWREYFDTAGF
jgi:uncharacterized protein (TIGR02246 family)